MLDHAVIVGEYSWVYVLHLVAASLRGDRAVPDFAGESWGK